MLLKSGHGKWPSDWSSDGRFLLYIELSPKTNFKMMAVEVNPGAAFQAGIPQPLFETQITRFTVRYAVTGDGKRFLIPTPTAEAGSTPATVVINWTAGIKR